MVKFNKNCCTNNHQTLSAIKIYFLIGELTSCCRIVVGETKSLRKLDYLEKNKKNAFYNLSLRCHHKRDVGTSSAFFFNHFAATNVTGFSETLSLARKSLSLVKKFLEFNRKILEFREK